MSDPMMDPGARFEGAKSMLNPTDVSTMKQSGELSQNMTVRDYLGKFGIDVDGPVTQLVEAFKKQSQTASMPGKMGAIAGGPGMGQPQKPFPQGRPPMVSGGLDALLK
jgi:hypothetical protein